MKQELLEVADQGLHSLAWQSNIEAESCKDSSAKTVVDSHDPGAPKDGKLSVNNCEKHGDHEEVDDNSKEKNSCDEEIDVFLDAEVEQDQSKLEENPPQDDEETQKLFKFQPRDPDDDEKFFIVQPLDEKESEQDRVIALMKNQDLTGSSDYEDITDVFRDIEIEDLEAEKENAGGNVIDVEKFLRDNGPLISKIHYKGDHKKLQDTSKTESCLETYEEIII